MFTHGNEPSMMSAYQKNAQQGNGLLLHSTTTHGEYEVMRPNSVIDKHDNNLAQFIGHFKRLSPSLHRQLMTSSAGADGNQGKYLSKDEEYNINECLQICPMTIRTQEEIEQEYLSMYAKPMKKEDDNK